MFVAIILSRCKGAFQEHLSWPLTADRPFTTPSITKYFIITPVILSVAKNLFANFNIGHQMLHCVQHEKTTLLPVYQKKCP